MNDTSAVKAGDYSTPAIPDEDRTWSLIEDAYAEGITVLGWADDMVLNAVEDRRSRVQFAVAPIPESPCGHEDQVLVVAIRVPHPDEKSLAAIVLGCGCCDLDGSHRHDDDCPHPCCPDGDGDGQDNGSSQAPSS